MVGQPTFGPAPIEEEGQALRRLFEGRFSRQKGYRLRKTLHSVRGNVLANTWEGT